ncbi:MAG: putative fibronectin/fibrinogen-binding proteinputative [Gemmatimonadetes bacterium]|nr:putative fibronectin/fibrinogen-binding proteinputative [Gemmatimonadota bacterium]
MSNPIRWDPALARGVAAELDRRLAGRSAHPSPRFDRDRSATLPLDRGEALRFDLHPDAGWVRVVPRPAGTEALAPTARIARVSAPPDERLLRIDLKEGNRFKGGSRTLVVELHTNQWNALLVDSTDRRIVSLLRTRDAGGRTLQSGAVYAPPGGEPRFGAQKATREEAWAFWEATLAPVALPERGAAFLRWFADASPLNARPILAPALADDSPAALLVAFERWWALHSQREAFPVVLRSAKGLQPYVAPLDGVPYDAAPSLLDAMEAVAGAAELPDASAGAQDGARLLALAGKRAAGLERRIGSLRKEGERAGEADRIRKVADHLLSYLQYVTEGASSARLPGWEDGVEVEVALDPALKPVENARRMYDEAGRRERAEQRLPELLAKAEEELARWQAAVAQAESGDGLPPWALRALAKSPPQKQRSGGAPAPRVPYRPYRTSGGLEVRVGRTSRDNDRLTFGHSSPGDVWLHARSVPGSHVILRWRDGDAAPPARDLEEAAVLAAVFSKARASGTVAVDWTRRKHVRKPRGAPPGSVTLLQARTIFVEPDPAVEERLREPDTEPASPD